MKNGFLVVFVVGMISFSSIAFSKDFSKTWVGVEVNPQAMTIGKNRFPGNTCVPLSGWAMLNAGAFDDQNPRELKNDISRVSEIIAECDREISNRVAEHGMPIARFINVLKAVMGEKISDQFSSEDFYRRDGETVREHLVRMHETLVKSLKNDIAPMISVVGRNFVQADGNFLWDSASVQHAMTITKIEASLDQNKDSFSLEIYDPDSQKLYDAIVFVPPRSFPSRQYAAEGGSGPWRIGSEKPYLEIKVAGLSLGDQDAPFWSRHVTYVRYAIGAFSTRPQKVESVDMSIDFLDDSLEHYK